MPYKRSRSSKRAWAARKRRRVMRRPSKVRKLGLRRRSRGLRFRSRSSKPLVLRTLKHHVALQPKQKTILNLFNCYRDALYFSAHLGSLAFRTGQPYSATSLQFRMNSVYDPIWAAEALPWGTQAAYHRYMSGMYKQYRVVKSWISVRVAVVAPVAFPTPGGAAGSNENLDKYGGGLAVSIFLDDDGVTPVAEDTYWTSLKTDPRAKVMIVPPVTDGTCKAYTVRKSWRLDRQAYGDDNTWSACAQSADVSMLANRALATIFLQRASISATATATAWLPITMQIRIVYKTQYRYPKDISVGVGQHNENELGVEEEEAKLDAEEDEPIEGPDTIVQEITKEMKV